jgi:hypothetical protein
MAVFGVGGEDAASPMPASVFDVGLGGPPGSAADVSGEAAVSAGGEFLKAQEGPDAIAPAAWSANEEQIVSRLVSDAGVRACLNMAAATLPQNNVVLKFWIPFQMRGGSLATDMSGWGADPSGLMAARLDDCVRARLSNHYANHPSIRAFSSGSSTDAVHLGDLALLHKQTVFITYIPADSPPFKASWNR